MTWLFAFVVVAVLGAVAVVAAGRGGSLGEVYDDRPDSRVPADGPLTAADLRQVRFSTALRGYRMAEVDALLDRLGVELDSLVPLPGPPTGAAVRFGDLPEAAEDGPAESPGDGQAES